MAATIRALGANAAGTTSATPGLPTGTVNGDLLICIAASSGSATEPSMSGGWTKIRTVKNGTALTDSMLTVWWHTGSSTTVSRAISSLTNHVSARIIGITTGTFNASAPINAESGGNVQASTTSVSISGLTTTVDDCLILSISGASLPDANSTAQYASWTNASLASITERTDNNVNNGNGGGHGSASGVKTTAGVVSATTATKASSALLANLMVAIAPFNGPPTVIANSEPGVYTTTYYVDGNILMQDESGTGWNNDANGFDGDTSTFMTNVTPGSANEFFAVGTTAPSSGNGINDVRFRWHDGTSWTSYDVLPAPIGGWSWSVLQNLYFEIRNNTGVNYYVGVYDNITDKNFLNSETKPLASSMTVSKIEIEVSSSTTTDNTPTLEFTGTDGQGDDIRYNVQVDDTSSSFSSLVLDKTSNTDSGFANIDTPADTDPFNSGDKVGYTIQLGDELANGTYYWRARGLDPSGSNTYGAWSATREFDVSVATGNYTGTPGIATLTTTRFTPTVTATNNQAITFASPSSLTITAQTPTSKLDNRVTPGIATLTLTAQTPTVTFTNNYTGTPAIATLTTTRFTPTATPSSNTMKVEGLIDNFSTDSLSTKWQGSYGDTAITGGQAVIPINSDYGDALIATGSYDFEESSIYLELASIPSTSGTKEVFIEASINSNNKFGFKISGGNLNFVLVQSATENTTNITFSDSTHRWLRLRESAGTLYWDTSTNGTSWTNRRSITYTIDASSLFFGIAVGYYGSESASSLIIDNVNFINTANTTVTPAVSTLTTTQFAPTVSATNNYAITAASPSSLIITRQTPTVVATNNIAITTATPTALVTTNHIIGVAVSANSAVTPDNASLTLTAQNPTVSATANIAVTPGANSLTLSPQTPIVDATANVAITLATPTALTTTRQTPTVSATNNYAITTASPTSLTLTALTPTVTFTANKAITFASPTSLILTNHIIGVALSDNEAVTPGTASLSTTPLTPTVSATDNKSITLASPSSLTLTAWSPTVAFTANTAVTPGNTSLTTTNYTPTVSATANVAITLQTASLSTTRYTPTVDISSSSTITPGIISLTLTPQAPVVNATNNFSITTASPSSLTTNRHTPTVQSTANVSIVLQTASLTITRHIPGVAVSNATAVTPGTASLTLTPQTPTVAITNNVSITLQTASLVLYPQAPSATATNNISITLQTASLVLSPQTPSVQASTNIEITPGVASMITAMFAPNVTKSQNSLVSPQTARLRLTPSYPIVNGQVRTNNLYFDSDGNAYYVIDQNIGILEKVT
jgi:hypothetical protein